MALYGEILLGCECFENFCINIARRCSLFCAIATYIGLDPMINPFISTIALFASSGVLNFTNPNPLDISSFTITYISFSRVEFGEKAYIVLETYSSTCNRAESTENILQFCIINRVIKIFDIDVAVLIFSCFFGLIFEW